jgi:glutathione S-transferase
MAAGETKLYVLPGSHPSAAVAAALELKRLPYRRIDLLPLTPLLVGPFLYGGTTVPGARIGSERVVGSRAIMRRLDQLAPEPPLLPPPGDELYARVLEAERWGDEVFQSVPRRILDVGFLRNPAVMESYAGDARLPLPRAALRNGASEETASADVAALPAQLERIDGWIAEGVLGGEQPNAADLQIGSSIRLLATIADVRPLLDAHRARELVRHFPPAAGEIPAGTLPAQWTATPAAS